MDIKQFSDQLNQVIDKANKFDLIANPELARYPHNCVSLDRDDIEAILTKMDEVGNGTERVYIFDGRTAVVEIDTDCTCGCGGTDTYEYPLNDIAPEFFHIK